MWLWRKTIQGEAAHDEKGQFYLSFIDNPDAVAKKDKSRKRETLVDSLLKLSVISLRGITPGHAYEVLKRESKGAVTPAEKDEAFTRAAEKLGLKRNELSCLFAASKKRRKQNALAGLCETHT